MGEAAAAGRYGGERGVWPPGWRDAGNRWGLEGGWRLDVGVWEHEVRYGVRDGAVGSGMGV